MLLLPLFVRKCWLSYGLAVFILLFHLPLGRAADLTVTTTTDVVNGDVSSPQALKANPGPDGISLREAVLAVNNAVGPHTITFAATLAGQTINITSPLFITRDGITLTGLSTPDGQPNITLDAVNITTGLCCNTLLFVYASDFTLTRLRITRVQNHALRIMAGQILYPPSAPSEVRNIRIEDNVFDNTGLEDYPLGDGDAIRIWMDPEGVAADASITNVSILRNTFRHFQGKGASGNGVIIVPSGTNCVIQDVVIQDNTFVDTKFPVEVGVYIGSRNRVVGTRIFGNTFTNGVVPVFIGVVASDRSASGSVIEDTVIRGNVFFGTLESVEMVGGQTNGGATNATGNSIINTQIVNNLIVTGRGIHIIGGGSGSSGNRVDGVQVINNTIVTHPLAGVRADKNRDDGTENSVTGVSVLNTIFQKREPDTPRPEDVIAGEITPDQVRFSIISTPGFVGVNGNFSADPKFVNPNFANPGEGDFHLQPGSPAIDAGTSDGAPSTDLECRTRFDDPSTPNTGEGAIRYYDIGAFEYGSPPTVCLTLTNEGTGNGTVTVNPTGNDCSVDNSLIYNIGTVVTLTATPNTGSTFSGWLGDVSANGNQCTVIIDVNKTVIATFTLLFSDVPSGYWADFDGDGATDVAAFHLPTDQFFTDYAGNLGQFGWGGSDSMPLIWDYDGDGKTDVSIYHIPTNQWFVKGYPGDNLGQFGWGGGDSVPVPGDYNGNGIVERAFYHSPTNRWFIEWPDHSVTSYDFGWNGADCIPVPGDYDGDGKTDMALYHVPSNQWFLYGVGNLGQFGWGGADCIPVPGDYNGDGKTEIAVYHVPSNQWFWRDEGGTAHFLGQYGWGGLESFPIPGDYDGDGVMERGFYRSSNNWWFIEGEPDFYWGWDGQNFMPITSQIAVYNWFRFMLGRFE